jgi:hypothetical protein
MPGALGRPARLQLARAPSSQVPNKPARKPRPHERNGWGQKVWPWKQEEGDLVKQCLAARKLYASRVPATGVGVKQLASKVVPGWNPWFNVAACCTGGWGTQAPCLVGRVALEPPATVWLGRARVKERRSARQRWKSARREQISVPGGQICMESTARYGNQTRSAYNLGIQGLLAY